MAFAFLVDSDDTIPTNHEGLACAWDGSHGKETEHGRIDASMEMVISGQEFPFSFSKVSRMDQEVMWAVCFLTAVPKPLLSLSPAA